MRLHTSSSEKKAGPRKQRGLATIEYALIASMIAVSGALAANTLSANLGTQFNLIASAVVGANGAINNDSARPGTQIMSIKSWQACPDSDQDKQDQGVRCRVVYRYLNPTFRPLGNTGCVCVEMRAKR